MRGARTIWLVALALLAAAVLTSCGGGENDSEDAASTATSTAAVLGELVEVDRSKLRVNGVVEAPTIEAIADIPPSKHSSRSTSLRWE